MSFFKKTADFWSEFRGRLTFRYESGPIDSLVQLTDFVVTRSAFVAQKTLYGYLKTRMGTRYPAMFEDQIFIDSINIAKLHVFAACLSDLSIYVVAYALKNLPARNPDNYAACIQLQCDVARRCFEAGLLNNQKQIGSMEQFSDSDARAEFEVRLQSTVWADAASGRDNFSYSSKALIEWAPIAPELKKYDTGIVNNSIMFAWHSIRETFKKRADPEKISAEAALLI